MSHSVGYFTRGGQLVAHRVRMFTQAFNITCISAMVSCGIWLSWLIVTTISFKGLYVALCAHWANCKLSMTEFFYGANKTHLTTISFWDNGWQTWSAKIFVNHPLTKQFINQFYYGVEGLFSGETLSQLLLIAMVGPIATAIFFWWRGREGRETILERGNCVEEVSVVARLLKSQKQDSDLRLDDLPLVKDKETSHILMTGTTGSGKSNCFNTLLPQVRMRGNSAVVLDLTGEFTKRYYRAGRDLILNPFDNRSVSWTPFVECFKDQHYRALAETIIPNSNKHDPFWEKAAQTILTVALQKLKERGGRLDDLYKILVQSDSKTFESFFAGTDASTYTSKDGERMTISIRATLSNHLQSLKYLSNPTSELFSVRRWIESQPKDQWLFLGCNADERAIMRPLMSSWIDTAINALMTCAPDQKRRFWFIMDEMPALHKLPSLGTGLAELRKYGGCILSGIQNMSQMEETYGATNARSLLDLYNTKIFFRSTDAHTTQWISKVLGEAETTEQIENTSFGANTMRDGVNTSQQTKTKPLVLPSEIADLEDLAAYIKLPGSYPITKQKLEFKKG